MPWRNVPLPRLIYTSEDQAALPDTLGERIVDAYLDELNVMHSRPGKEEFSDLGTSAPIDGLYWWDKKKVPIAVSAGRIFRINSSSGDFTEFTGDELNNNSIVTFADNGDLLLMANGGRIVQFDNVGNTSFIADPDAPTTVSHVAFFDQFILANLIGSQQIQFSEVNDPTNWRAIDVFSAEAHQDDIQSLLVANREISAFGQDSIERFFNNGVTPFRRIENMNISRGTIAKHSVVNANGTWIFLDHERRVTMLTGNQVRIISIPFANVTRDLTPVNDAEAFFMTIAPRSYYVLSFPTAKITIVYDPTTNSWAEWGTYNIANDTYGLFDAKSYAYAKDFNFHLVGSRTNGKIFKVSNSIFQDDGSLIRPLLRTGHISHGTNERKRSNQLVIRLKRGLGSISGDEPKISLRWRDDNGPFKQTVTLSLGKIGETEFIARRHRMGSYRRRQYEFVHSANTDFVLVDIQEDVEILET